VTMSAPRRRQLSILDVGHGNCAVLADDRGTVVIDAGPGSTLLEFLVDAGISSIDVVLISHADEDHLGGLIAVLGSKRFKIGRVRLNSDALKGSAVWDDLLHELNACDKAGSLDWQTSLTFDKSGQFDQGSIRIEILAPSKYLAAKGPGGTDGKGRRVSTNSISAVVRLLQGNEPVALLAADLDRVGFDDLVDSGQEARAPIAVFPHHGGRPASADAVAFTRAFCQLVTPTTVLFSIGRGRHATPVPDIVAAVLTFSPTCRIACTQLSEHCAAALPRRKARHLEKVFARGRERGQCCAGSLVLYLDKVPILMPSVPSHQAFIRRAASTALCRRG